MAGGSTGGGSPGSINTPVSPENIAQLTGGATGASPMAGVNPSAPNMPGIQSGGSAAMQALSNSSPQWMKGLQLGQQISQMGGQQRPPMQLPQRPMGGPPPGFGGGGMQTGAVPGAGGMMPQAPQMPNMGGLMGPQQGAPSQINPAMLQMLLRSRGMGG